MGLLSNPVKSIPVKLLVSIPIKHVFPCLPCYVSFCTVAALLCSVYIFGG